jgi:hypothetical protein
MANPTTNYSFAMPTNTDLVKDLPADFEIFGQAVDTQMKTNADAAIAKTIVDAKGDIIAATAADTVSRLAVGTNGQYLAANSSTATGLEWQTVSAGGMTLISEQVASANTAIDFTSISQNYKQLLLIWSGIQHSGTGGGFGIRLNSNSGSVYSYGTIGLDGNAITAPYGTTTMLGDDAFGHRCNYTQLHYQARGFLQIDNYASTTKVKNCLLRFSYADQGSGVARGYSDLVNFNDTTAITSVNIFRRSGSDTISNSSNTSIRLYGLS